MLSTGCFSLTAVVWNMLATGTVKKNMTPSPATYRYFLEYEGIVEGKTTHAFFTKPKTGSMESLHTGREMTPAFDATIIGQHVAFPSRIS